MLVVDQPLGDPDFVKPPDVTVVPHATENGLLRVGSLQTTHESTIHETAHPFSLGKCR